MQVPNGWFRGRQRTLDSTKAHQVERLTRVTGGNYSAKFSAGRF